MKISNAAKRHVANGWNKVKEVAVDLKNGAQALAVTAAAGVAALFGQVNDAAAALPASVATTVTAIQADGQSIFDLIFPVVGAFLGLVIVIKLFKRFGNKV